MDVLSAETVICRMSLALHECPDLSIRDSRRWAYLKRNISESHIRAFDNEAVRYEKIRRRLWPQKVPGLAGIVARMAAVCIASFGAYAVWCATPAYAASATLIQETDWSSSFLTAGAWLGGLTMLAILAAMARSYIIYPNSNPLCGGPEYGPEPTREEIEGRKSA